MIALSSSEANVGEVLVNLFIIGVFDTTVVSNVSYISPSFTCFIPFARGCL